jgi:hypothetical protein
MVTLRDFLTPAQIRTALLIWNSDRPNFHARVLAEVIEPAMPEINRKLKQENVPAYLAYLIEYVFIESQR